MELTHFFYKESTWELTQAIPFKAVNLLVGKKCCRQIESHCRNF